MNTQHGALIPSHELVSTPLAGNEELIIGILTCDRPVTEAWFNSLGDLASGLRQGFLVRRGSDTGQDEVPVAHNAIVERALAQKARYVFFLEDDVVVPPRGIKEVARGP